MRTITTDNQDRKFLSLKWKIVLLSGLILLVVVMLFCTISYLGLMANFDNQREVEYQRYSREIDSNVKDTSLDLQQLAEMIPFLDGMGTALLANNGSEISRVFDQHWTMFQFRNGVESVHFYNASNKLTANWGIFNSNIDRDGTLLSWVRSVNEHEQPISPLHCRERCMQYTVAPLLVAGHKTGVIVIAISLADVLLGFKRVTGSDIGLLIKDQNAPTNNDEKMHFLHWQARMMALTNKKVTREILYETEAKYTNLVSLLRGVQVNWRDAYQQVKLFPLTGSVPFGNAHLVVITDVTVAVQNIYNSIWKIGLIGLLGLIFSEFLLVIIFTRLLSRLKDIAITLPLLASGDFENFRVSLTSSDQQLKLRDEVDTLYESAVALSLQLEHLENKISTRTEMLMEQKNELSKERDFIAHLLDTAQVIVLTQNPNGQIISLNAYGEMLTHYTEEELAGSPFLEILASEHGLKELSSRLEEIHLGQKEQLRHEAITYCKDGTTRHVAWLHSRLNWKANDDASVLSVGLDITEYKRVEGHLAWLADHDPLTNLFNRRRFSEELEQVLSWAERYQHPGALLFFDLDRFKYINDTSGHQAGDALLRMVSGMLSRTIRTDDITGRLGGDEFAVILPEIDKVGAIEVAKKILAQLGEAQLTIHNRTHKISASIGIALFPGHGDNVHELLAAADLAMYQAKETGRNAWHLFSKDDRSRERIHKLVFWKEKIEHALLYDNFMLYLQPIMDLQSKNIRHYEVLLRMRDKDGILGPEGFIAAAEHTGLIHSIDHMVLRKAIGLVARINKEGEQVSFSINLSAHAFNDPELLPILKQELRSHNVDPNHIMFEITETAALENLPAARALMTEIKELGCGFILDDFGVGFSSFYYLRELPVDAIKIDGSFIRNLDENSDDQILVNALCSVARGFGKRITAEFVEREEIFTLISTMDVDFVQGYFIGEPAPADDYISQEITKQ